MDVNDLRSFLTLAGFVCFIAIAVWAYSRGARKGFDEAAMLPFADEEGERATMAQPTIRGEAS
ncbi:MAG: CcoQ/FixQ family Cbb3-type cytochrome c oxidase assembly chaperone [Candidatus Dactylopiibacterium carminicum]|uniref:CcoQ/FixQ family Cbb3-type cytochrome c oxidase assembly chaperone n=1 Tax=Candidatus Dactylopiibacterium carminicum TaxID=857335 RepID=A0A272ENM1_9RHOO|nr:CcoQ/FixQ family Cbb3-type cytochrome c oxidase assembly chaperone [Candidatus Dactylopiibacterium carminicum]KAF7599121.1 CcoQ/FixQ family Cbb3-type cytochrome c oxidase assembly chaperone [Candidatus Dactylopiibacterium carminicum]PAS91699.1 MAG: CcoQ/FixQ family Cbb3-type cytochrome c oxidase assembly chaperone [Candidatus Dactylopiibacterium carminicum]PAS93765.1 MAG: CcoQ/FixQ family Cbb3-type cytochrome c oxidase assembly chaperone [Candidatus Dactylopiibacterium carminicum]PAS99135.1 